MQKVVWSDTIVNGGNIRNLTLPMPEALDGYYEDIVTYAIPLERQPEDTSLKPKVTFGNLKSAVIKDESKAVNRDEKGVFRSSYPCWIQYEYAEPVTCSNVEIILGGNKTGKSSIIKSIFTTLGCECKRIETDWKKLISAYLFVF